MFVRRVSPEEKDVPYIPFGKTSIGFMKYRLGVKNKIKKAVFGGASVCQDLLRSALEPRVVFCTYRSDISSRLTDPKISRTALEGDIR